LSDYTDQPTRRYQGECRWFSPEKNFGFIALPLDEDGTAVPDVFVHFRGIRGTGFRNLQDGQRVDFEIVKGEKGPQANDVMLINEDGTLSEVVSTPKPARVEAE
jgi:CspA family cold shock protein